MTDRLHALTVHLAEDIRDDDAEPLIAAILMLKGVSRVEPHVVDVEDHFARQRVRQELRQELIKVLWPDD